MGNKQYKDCLYNHRNDEVKLRKVFSLLFDNNNINYLQMNITKIIENYFYTRCSFTTCNLKEDRDKYLYPIISHISSKILCPDCIKYIFTYDVKTQSKVPIFCCSDCKSYSRQYIEFKYRQKEEEKSYNFFLNNYDLNIFNVFNISKNDQLYNNRYERIYDVLNRFAHTNNLILHIHFYGRNTKLEQEYVSVFFVEQTIGKEILSVVYGAFSEYY